MPSRFRTAKQQRASALVTVLCCLWMSTIGSLFHTDGPLMLPQAGRVTSAGMSAAGGPHLVWTRGSRRAESPGDCAACQWQANSVSPAMPGFSLTLGLRRIPHTIAALPLYSGVRFSRSSARSPPAA